MLIIGAGMAGLLAANMLRDMEPTILEQQPVLPNNHSAVLRFRSHIVGDVLNVPFRKVTMIKCTVGSVNAVADALNYSLKCTGVRRTDRSLLDGLQVDTRFIAPKDLIARMVANTNIEFGKKLEGDFNVESRMQEVPIISTIPMPALMSILRYPFVSQFDFLSVHSYNIRFRLPNCDAYCSVYDTRPDSFISRVSITGDEVIVEIPMPSETKRDVQEQLDRSFVDRVTADAKELLGIARNIPVVAHCSSQRYAKIIPVDDRARQEFIHWATDRHNIYSLGRYATWRPKLLLDDLVNDIRLISRWSREGRYAVTKHRTLAVVK